MDRVERVRLHAVLPVPAGMVPSPLRRVRRVSVRVEQFTDADGAARQMSFDAGRENARRLDLVIDHVNARFGPGTVPWRPLAHRRHSD